MSNIAIKVENLGKKYFIRHEKKESYETFQDVLINGGKKIITSLNPFDKSSVTEDETIEEFWALKDVNFEINKGDKVGIIGRNGAGKSTLLKVLSRITEPTTGKIHINGRIASLLEVGTGFHPELTGRENIYLNGAILGMSRAEIRGKFDEIVAFAEVEKFLDTPVKRYSSGMYVRLAFSVAAHLEPEILVVDEVLAVGDVEFQKKCLGKMGEVSKEGRTILFVSHNMNAIEQLCEKGIFMTSGKSEYFSFIGDAVEKYINYNPNNIDINLEQHRKIKDLSRLVEFESLHFKKSKNLFESCENIEFVANMKSLENIINARISLTIYSSDGTVVGSCFSGMVVTVNKNTLNSVIVVVPIVNLAPGRYYMGVAVGKGTNKTGNINFDIIFDILHFEIKQCTDSKGTVSSWSRGWGNVMFDELQIKAV